MFEVVRYTPEKADEWNTFTARSRNGTFLFDRRYMDYHSARYHDHSLMIYDRGRLVALFPANETVDGRLISHEGLTYGGLIVGRKTITDTVINAFSTLEKYLITARFQVVIYKAVPRIYHDIPSEEDLYVLTQICKARLIGRDLSSVVELRSRIRFTELRRRGTRKAQAAGISITESDDIDTFWQILDNNLTRKYGVHPVHSASELRLLKHRFPSQIRLFVAREGQETVAGTVVYVCRDTIHAQYIAASTRGKQTGALDLLFARLLDDDFREARYFDFGRSTETLGQMLNRGLIFQKEGFGARGVCYDTYEWYL